MAAGMTAKDRRCHRLHVSFLAPGDPISPIEYRVRRLRGRRFALRVAGESRDPDRPASFTAEPPQSHVH
jgi:acyl-CoA thioesterase